MLLHHLEEVDKIVRIETVSAAKYFISKVIILSFYFANPNSRKPVLNFYPRKMTVRETKWFTVPMPTERFQTKGPLTVSCFFCLFLEGLQKCTGISDLDLYGTKMFAQYLFLYKKWKSLKENRQICILACLNRSRVRSSEE